MSTSRQSSQTNICHGNSAVHTTESRPQREGTDERGHRRQRSKDRNAETQHDDAMPFPTTNVASTYGKSRRTRKGVSMLFYAMSRLFFFINSLKNTKRKNLVLASGTAPSSPKNTAKTRPIQSEKACWCGTSCRIPKAKPKTEKGTMANSQFSSRSTAGFFALRSPRFPPPSHFILRPARVGGSNQNESRRRPNRGSTAFFPRRKCQRHTFLEQ